VRVTVDECFFHCPKAFLRASLWQPETWPGHRVSFGKIFAAQLGGDDTTARQIDEALEQDAQNL